jgi:AcrR family transcriptional regulator
MNSQSGASRQEPTEPDSADGHTRTRLILAGLDTFTARGFEGTSLRDIERAAGLSRGLAAYHFGSKDGLWRAAVEWLMAQFRAEFVAYQHTLRDLPPASRERIMLLVFARFCGKFPQFFRLLVLECHERTERAEWLISQHLLPAKNFFDRVSGRTVDPDPLAEAIAYFGFVGAAATLSAANTAGQLLFDVDATDEEVVESTAQAASRVGLLLTELERDRS